MTTSQLLQIRLENQQLIAHSFSNPGDLVEWMGAVQAQDYLGALWSIGMRIPRSSERSVENAVEQKKIVRSWPMRGTLHFVSPADIRWMLKYLASKVASKVASVYRREELDTKQFVKAMKLWEKALQADPALTREEMYSVLQKGKLSTKGIRGLLMLGYAAQEGLICFGARKGKQQTLVLLDEWIPSKAPMISKEEAMKRLAEIYIRSHGPVMVEDLAWWAGLNKTEATGAVRSLQDELLALKCGVKTYWMCPAEVKKPKPICALLPTYDEFGIAYKDRSPIIHKTDLKQVGGFFTSGIMHNGKITGVWRREIKKDQVHVEVKPFATYTIAQSKMLQSSIKNYSEFLGVKAITKM
jgi:hypothetical protein